MILYTLYSRLAICSLYTRLPFDISLFRFFVFDIYIFIFSKSIRYLSFSFLNCIGNANVFHANKAILIGIETDRERERERERQ